MNKLYVYVVVDENTQLVKIGRSIKVIERYKALATQSSGRLRLAGSFETYSTKAETDAHKHFAVFRKHGEWFDIPESKALDTVRNICLNYPFSHEQHKLDRCKDLLNSTAFMRFLTQGPYCCSECRSDQYRQSFIEHIFLNFYPIDLWLAARIIGTTATKLWNYLQSLGLLTDTAELTDLAVKSGMLEKRDLEGPIFTKEGLLTVLHIIGTIEREGFILEPCSPPPDQQRVWVRSTTVNKQPAS